MKVRLFAALRELAGSPELEVEANDVGSLLDQLSAKLGPEFDRIMSAGTVVVGGEKAERDHPLGEGEEVALLPPVSGGTPRKGGTPGADDSVRAYRRE
jgi:MoaD family protein